jgi:hypothetical protein
LKNRRHKPDQRVKTLTITRARNATDRRPIPGTNAYRNAVGKLVRGQMSYDEFIELVEAKARR